MFNKTRITETKTSYVDVLSRWKYESNFYVLNKTHNTWTSREDGYIWRFIFSYKMIRIFRIQIAYSSALSNF